MRSIFIINFNIFLCKNNLFNLLNICKNIQRLVLLYLRKEFLKFTHFSAFWTRCPLNSQTNSSRNYLILWKWKLEDALHINFQPKAKFNDNFKYFPIKINSVLCFAFKSHKKGTELICRPNIWKMLRTLIFDNIIPKNYLEIKKKCPINKHTISIFTIKWIR